MSLVTTVVARTDADWSATEVDVTGVGDVDELVDAVRDAEPDADVRLLFVEEEDEYVGIVRVDGSGYAENDAVRIFLSDRRAGESFPLAAMLVEGIDAHLLDPDAVSGRYRGGSAGARSTGGAGGAGADADAGGINDVEDDETAAAGEELGGADDAGVPDIDLASDGSLLATAGVVGVDEDSETAADIDSRPVGDAGLVSDLGTPAPSLIALCERGGTLPGDLVAAICENAGAGEALDELRD